MKNILRILPLVLAITLLLAWPSRPQTKPHSIGLSWTASTTAGVTYNVYRGTAAGGPYAKISTAAVSALSYTDTSGTGGTKYFYVVTAVDASAFESVYSNEASATFLANPAAATGLAAVSN